jgi:acyl transferase domain-containing protein
MWVRSVRLFPGQGSFRPGCLAALRAGRDVSELLAEIDEVGSEFGYAPVTPALSDPDTGGDPESARERDQVQLAVFAQALAINTARGKPDVREVLVGHSIGEIASLTAAGVFDAATGARVVCLRNTVLQDEPRAGGGLMALAISAQRAAHLLAAVGDHRLAIAAENAPRQTVVSGSWEALDELAVVGRAMKIEAIALKAPYAFHNPALRSAAARFAELLSPLHRRPLQARVYSPIAQAYYSDDDDLAEQIASHLYLPVRFTGAIRALHAAGVSEFIECAPVGVLGKLVAATVPDVVVRLHRESAESAYAAEPEDRRTASIVAEPPSQRWGGPAVASAAEVPLETAQSAGSETPPTVLDREAVLADLRSIYAAALDYPETVITDEADLEADLGVDSMQQTELLIRVSAQYELPPPGKGDGIADITTLSDVAEFVIAGSRASS